MFTWPIFYFGWCAAPPKIKNSPVQKCYRDSTEIPEGDKDYKTLLKFSGVVLRIVEAIQIPTPFNCQGLALG